MNMAPMDENYQVVGVWVRGMTGSVPHNAVLAGRDKDGGLIYVGRASHQGDMLPAKVIPKKGGAFVPYGGGEHSKFDYEVLCDPNVAWQQSAYGNVPPRAVQVGRTSTGEPLYCGRVMHDGALTPGKVHPSHRKLYIPYGGREVAFDAYEILIHA